MERIDTWIGKTLFVPLIIRLCQRVGCTQFTCNRVCWFIVGLTGLYFADSFWMKIIYGVVATICCLMAALLPAHYPETSGRLFRMLVVSFIVLGIPTWFPNGPDWHLPHYLLVLFAEYATTIRTIPPLGERKTKRTYKLARAKG